MVSCVCFIHVCVSPKGLEVLENQINKMKKFGLYQKLKRIYIGVLGDYIQLMKHNIYLDNDKLEVVYFSKDVTEMEFPTLINLKKFCDTNQENHHILYIHTKGVRNPNNPFIDQWRNYMEYFLIERHEHCLKDLEKYDTAGVNHHVKPWNHYSGNFWWSNSNHIKKLVDPDSLSRKGLTYLQGGRWNAEKWLLTYFNNHNINNVEIIKGEYGSGEKIKDVTNILTRMITDNRIYIKQGKCIQKFFSDPFPGKMKTLKISYKISNSDKIYDIIKKERGSKLTGDLLIDGNSKVIKIKNYHESGIHHYHFAYPRDKYEIKD